MFYIQTSKEVLIFELEDFGNALPPFFISPNKEKTGSIILITVNRVKKLQIIDCLKIEVRYFLSLNNFIWDKSLHLIIQVRTSQNGQTHSNNLSATTDELFECIWPFCGVGALRVNEPFNQEHNYFEIEQLFND